MTRMFDVLGVNVLDRMLSFYASQANRPLVGDTFNQGDNMPQFFFVDSATGADGNDGRNPRTPVATLGAAFDLVSANRGDIIFLMPLHAETLTATLALDVAGVTVIGLGHGASRPTFTVGDAVGESVSLTAASVRVENVIFLGGVDQQTTIVGFLAADCALIDCDVRENTGEPLTGINLTGAAANDTDRALVSGCVITVPTAGDGNEAILLGEVADGIVIQNCAIWGDFDEACIQNPTGKVLTNLLIKDCILTNLLTGQHSIQLVSACTGNLVRNMYANDLTQATGADTGACKSFECFHCDAVDVSGILNPIIT